MKFVEPLWRIVRDTVFGLGLLVFAAAPLGWGLSGVFSLAVWCVLIGVIVAPAARWAWGVIDARR